MSIRSERYLIRYSTPDKYFQSHFREARLLGREPGQAVPRWQAALGIDWDRNERWFDSKPLAWQFRIQTIVTLRARKYDNLFGLREKFRKLQIAFVLMVSLLMGNAESFNSIGTLTEQDVQQIKFPSPGPGPGGGWTEGGPEGSLNARG